MIPIPVILGGISLGAAIVGAIANALTDDEKKKQEQLRKEQAQYTANGKRRRELIEKKLSREFETLSKQEQEAINKELAALEVTEKELREELRQRLISEASQRIDEKHSLIDDLRTTNKNIQSALKEQGSLLRRITLQRLRREITEAESKTRSYIKYLHDYIFYMQQDLVEEDIVCFEFLLPKNALYAGKLLYLESTELVKGNGTISIATGLYQSYSIEDAPTEADEAQNLQPLLCISYDLENRSYVLSHSKGKLKSYLIDNPKVGVTAVVNEYVQEKNGWRYINLRFDDAVDLKLPYRNLENPNRIPPLGAELRVYPVNWDNTLFYKIEVSEHSRDAYLNMSFEHIPVIFTEDQWFGEFEQYLKENGLAEHAGDWKIAPLVESDIPQVDKFKLQLDKELVFAAEMVTLNFQSRPVHSLRFTKMLDKSEMLKPDDIFLGIDCTLDTILDNEIDYLEPEDFDNMESLILATLSEFRVQQQIKLSKKGMPYFEKWREVTDKLVSYLYKGPCLEINLENCVELVKNRLGEATFKIRVEDPERLEQFVDAMYDRVGSKRNAKFFFEISTNSYQYITINGQATELTVRGDEQELKDFFANNKCTLLYFKDFCYAELQQLSALNSFRMGKLYNPLLQGYALDSSNIKARAIEGSSTSVLFNPDIVKDVSQKEAVDKALQEENLFLIQGPPGTGKTTVIREIIEQTLAKNPNAKLLVVSQANVAVDNVLKGLLKRGKDYSFIRCGSNDKIDEELEKYSFDYKYNSYVEQLKARYEKNKDPLLKSWLAEIEVDGNSQYNSMLGELILKSTPIIGATCVGLARKRIGLDRIMFDLVIIDEAGKALPAEILIPYIRGQKVIMIGDHKQLPPTLNAALMDDKKVGIEDREIFEDELFSDSLFARMFNHAPETNKCMLKTQYRMPEVIGSLISDCFYQGELKNGSTTDSRPPMAKNKSNIVFLDLKAPENSESGRSVDNEKEAQTALKIVKAVYQAEPSNPRIAVITPYKGQLRLLRKLFADFLEKDLLEHVDINTIDAFQGDEADIVLFCTTRQKTRTKFFTDYRRINVAFSRTKNTLFIIGSLAYFDSYKNYGSGESPLPLIANYVREHAHIITMK